ncbi:MAG TPA: hypothetical protein PKD59_00550 [Miltoncostaeaceae bacterium]|nr:hypothetical protein [Miltoncostaeaceae bacterium]
MKKATEQQVKKIAYETPRVRDHGSISDHTFRRSERRRPKISINPL